MEGKEIKEDKIPSQGYDITNAYDGYTDDTSYPYRRLSRWFHCKTSLGRPLITSSLRRHPLPEDGFFGKTFALHGYLLPTETTSASGKPESLAVVIRPNMWVVDRSSSLRGIWVQTDLAWYWLLDPSTDTVRVSESSPEVLPSQESLHIPLRAKLGLLSNIIDVLEETNHGKQYNYISLHAKRTPESVHKLLSPTERQWEYYRNLPLSHDYENGATIPNDKSEDDDDDDSLRVNPIHQPQLNKEPFDLNLLRTCAQFVHRHLNNFHRSLGNTTMFMKGLEEMRILYEKETLIHSGKKSTPNKANTVDSASIPITSSTDTALISSEPMYHQWTDDEYIKSALMSEERGLRKPWGEKLPSHHNRLIQPNRWIEFIVQYNLPCDDWEDGKTYVGPLSSHNNIYDPAEVTHEAVMCILRGQHLPRDLPPQGDGSCNSGSEFLTFQVASSLLVPYSSSNLSLALRCLSNILSPAPTWEILGIDDSVSHHPELIVSKFHFREDKIPELLDLIVGDYPDRHGIGHVPSLEWMYVIIECLRRSTPKVMKSIFKGKNKDSLASFIIIFKHWLSLVIHLIHLRRGKNSERTKSEAVPCIEDLVASSVMNLISDCKVINSMHQIMILTKLSVDWFYIVDKTLAFAIAHKMQEIIHSAKNAKLRLEGIKSMDASSASTTFSPAQTTPLLSASTTGSLTINTVPESDATKEMRQKRMALLYKRAKSTAGTIVLPQVSTTAELSVAAPAGTNRLVNGSLETTESKQQLASMTTNTSKPWCDSTQNGLGSGDTSNFIHDNNSAPIHTMESDNNKYSDTVLNEQSVHSNLRHSKNKEKCHDHGVHNRDVSIRATSSTWTTSAKTSKNANTSWGSWQSSAVTIDAKSETAPKPMSMDIGSLPNINSNEVAYITETSKTSVSQSGMGWTNATKIAGSTAASWGNWKKSEHNTVNQTASNRSRSTDENQNTVNHSVLGSLPLDIKGPTDCVYKEHISSGIIDTGSSWRATIGAAKSPSHIPLGSKTPVAGWARSVKSTDNATSTGGCWKQVHHTNLTDNELKCQDKPEDNSFTVMVGRSREDYATGDTERSNEYIGNKESVCASKMSETGGSWTRIAVATMPTSDLSIGSKKSITGWANTVKSSGNTSLGWGKRRKNDEQYVDPTTNPKRPDDIGILHDTFPSNLLTNERVDSEKPFASSSWTAAVTNPRPETQHLTESTTIGRLRSCDHGVARQLLIAGDLPKDRHPTEYCSEKTYGTNTSLVDVKGHELLSSNTPVDYVGENADRIAKMTGGHSAVAGTWVNPAHTQLSELKWSGPNVVPHSVRPLLVSTHDYSGITLPGSRSTKDNAFEVNTGWSSDGTGKTQFGDGVKGKINYNAFSELNRGRPDDDDMKKESCPMPRSYSTDFHERQQFYTNDSRHHSVLRDSDSEDGEIADRDVTIAYGTKRKRESCTDTAYSQAEKNSKILGGDIVSDESRPLGRGRINTLPAWMTRDKCEDRLDKVRFQMENSNIEYNNASNHTVQPENMNCGMAKNRMSSSSASTSTPNLGRGRGTVLPAWMTSGNKECMDSIESHKTFLSCSNEDNISSSYSHEERNAHLGHTGEAHVPERTLKWQSAHAVSISGGTRIDVASQNSIQGRGRGKDKTLPAWMTRI